LVGDFVSFYGRGEVAFVAVRLTARRVLLRVGRPVVVRRAGLRAAPIECKVPDHGTAVGRQVGGVLLVAAADEAKRRECGEVVLDGADRLASVERQAPLGRVGGTAVAVGMLGQPNEYGEP
jgi:hypothetical protein